MSLRPLAGAAAAFSLAFAPTVSAQDATGGAAPAAANSMADQDWPAGDGSAQEGPAQDGPGGRYANIDMSDSVFDDNYITLGVGGAISPSYTGSDDYVFSALPFVQGSLLGVDISPSAAGVTLDFLPDPDDGVGYDLGIATRLRSNRVDRIEDETVAQYGELDRAIEVGPSVGISFPKVLIPVDKVSIGVDALWDVAGAHGGMTIAPSVSYFTPLSLGAAAQLSFGAEWADENFHDYYFRVDPAQFTGPGASPLAAYEPDGGGFTSVGANLLVAYDLDNNALNGGLGLVTILNYSHLVGDAAANPFTSERGSRNQFLAVIGIAYTF